MQLHTDLSQRVVLTPDQHQWVDSPMPGVSRLLLDRAGAETARATSLVRYAAGAGYHPHTHGGGEEILVLSGVFSDEHGDYPAGTYLRNPPGSCHTPFSREGCELLVKLWQFNATDQQTLVLASQSTAFLPGLVPGLSVLPLHQHDGVQTALVRWAPHTQFNRHVHVGGEEILVLEGCFYDEFGDYPAKSWLRNPAYSQHQPFTRDEGALIYVKTGFIGAGFLGDVWLTPA
jgi:anti-sigma factor ChrR (cupin superfamily)